MNNRLKYKLIEHEIAKTKNAYDVIGEYDYSLTVGELRKVLRGKCQELSADKLKIMKACPIE